MASQSQVILRSSVASTNLRGKAGVDIIPEQEWSTLIAIAKQSDNFDPLMVVSRERVRKSLLNGIPPELRGHIWCMLCRSQREKDMHGEGMYIKLKDPSIANAEDVHRIKKDVNRTFNNYPDYKPLEGHIDWRSEEAQQMLFNILVAYSNYDSRIGYVQGINYIVGLLLMSVEDEEQVFWCLLYIMNRKNWRCVYQHDMSKLHELLNTTEQKLAMEYPALLEHLQENDFSVGAAFSPLFITLYIY